MWASVNDGLTPPLPLKASGSNHVLPCPFSIKRALSRLAAHAIGFAYAIMSAQEGEEAGEKGVEEKEDENETGFWRQFISE
jgi:hypothetical protein